MIKEGIEPRINLQQIIIPVEFIQHHGITSPQSGVIPLNKVPETNMPTLGSLSTVYVVLC